MVGWVSQVYALLRLGELGPCSRVSKHWLITLGGIRCWQEAEEVNNDVEGFFEQ